MDAYLVWFFVGLAFLLAELALPGFIVLFFGIGAWVASAASALTDITPTQQVILFTVASLISILTLRRTLMRIFMGSSRPDPDREIDDATGRSAVVSKAINPPLPGEIRYHGSFWIAYAETAIPEGATVTITGPAAGEAMSFMVAPAQGS